MSIPGFTAERSLVPSSVEYHYTGLSTSAGISPEFLDFVKEAFEDLGHDISELASDAANGLKKAFDFLRATGGHSGQNMTCNGLVGNLFRCNGSSPALASADMFSNCIQRMASSDIPAAGLICSGIAGSLYPLLVQYCKSPGGKSQADIINQVCANT